MHNIFSPRKTPFVAYSIDEILAEPQDHCEPIYEEKPDDTPQNWFVRDYRDFIDHGITYIPYDENWWALFTNYEGSFCDVLSHYDPYTTGSPVTRIFIGQQWPHHRRPRT